MILKTLVALVLTAAPAYADVVRIEVKSRADVLGGQAFGATRRDQLAALRSDRDAAMCDAEQARECLRK